MNDKRIGISMTNRQLCALTAVLARIDQGRDPRVMMRDQAFRDARSVLARAEIRARRGEVGAA